MTPVSQFAQYLLRQDPQRNPARTTLFNFVRHVLDQTLPFTPAVLATFYARVLQFDHWRSEAARLTEVVRHDLAGYLAVSGEDVAAWTELRHPDTLQVVPIKVFADLEELVRLEHAARLKSGDTLKVIKHSDKEILALLLSPTGTLEAKVYPNLALVWGPRLRLTAPVSQLHYGPELELAPRARQLLEGSLITTHCFHVDDDGVHGLIVRGHTFQKFETFIRAKLSETQDLFTSLKKIERHFVEAQSDPYYQEVISKLERANQLLSLPNGRDTLLEAERALNRGRQCLKNIFPNDRLLTLLVTHLDYGISQKREEPAAPHGRHGAQAQ